MHRYWKKGENKNIRAKSLSSVSVKTSIKHVCDISMTFPSFFLYKYNGY